MNETKHVYVVLCMAGCIMFPVLSTLEGRGEMPVQRETYAEGELLVGFFERVGGPRRDEIHKEMGSTVRKRFETIPVDHVKLREGLATRAAIKQYLAYTNEVRYAEPNYGCFPD